MSKGVDPLNVELLSILLLLGSLVLQREDP